MDTIVKRCSKTFGILLALVLLLSGVNVSAQTNLNLTVANGISGIPLSGLTVHAMERLANGSGVWRAQAVTDPQGRAAYTLNGLGSGRSYYFLTEPYNGGWITSRDLSTAGTFNFLVGQLRVTVRNGENGSVLAGKAVAVGREQANGSVQWTQSLVTNNAGQLHLDPADLANGGAPVILAATSPLTGEYKLRQPITDYGAVDFVVGGAGLTVTVSNGISGAAVNGLEVHAMERLANGSSVWRARQTTNAQGQASFDLDGLGSGRTYYLTAEPYNGGWITSRDLTTAGAFDFAVGRLRVTVRNGGDGSVLSGKTVAIGREQSNGSVQWTHALVTNNAGQLHLDPADLANGGAPVILAATSPLTGQYKLRQPITDYGAVDFVVGGAGLTLTVSNGISGTAVTDLEVHAMERLANGSNVWRATETTNAQGQASFDLDGLGSGRTYYFTAEPYNGGWITSRDITSAGAVTFPVGTVPVRLIDDATGSSIAGKQIAAARKLPTGQVVPTASGVTDSAGIVRFDLPALADGAVYVFVAENPLGLGRSHYSALITSTGAVSFRVAADSDQETDFTPPELVVVAPSYDAAVASAGFRVYGHSSDNDTLKDVAVQLSDPVRGIQTVSGTLDANSGSWAVDIPASAISPGSNISLTVTVSDASYNEAVEELVVSVVADTQAPSLTITSHTSGQIVPASSFILSGYALDNTAVVSLTARLHHSALGTTVPAREVEHAPDSGRWSFVVPEAAVASPGTATVIVEARDAQNRVATASAQLQVVQRDRRARHLINRITMGATPELLATLEVQGADQFLDQQLAPESIDDSLLAAKLAAGPPNDLGALQTEQITRAVFSRRQLQEVMTIFWENHFNTDFARHNTVRYEYNENQAFRANALGRFRDLLGLSASNPAMLFYLDGVFSYIGAPNENYARELLELHTLGLDGGYTQQDVNEVARAFTGWTVMDGDFSYVDLWHDDGAKVVLGEMIPAGGGISDGETVLDLVAQHPSTAKNLCRKLALRFVSDTPTESLIDECANVFSITASEPDQIAQVLEFLLTSPEFDDPSNYRAKIKRPLEFTAGVVRNFSADQCCDRLPDYLFAQGVSLFNYPIPTGLPLKSQPWINTSRMLEQIWMLQVITFGDPIFKPVSVDLANYFSSLGYETAEGIVGYLLHIAFDDDVTSLERTVALGALTDGGSNLFWLGAPDAELRLNRLLAIVLGYPGYQFK